MACQRADQRAGAALRTQPRVDRPGHLRADPHHRRRELRGRAQRALLVLLAVHGLGDEDDVDVAHVVELPAAGLAHADDGQPAGGGVLGHPRERHREAGRQHGRRQVGQLTGDVLEREGTGQVARRERQQAAPVGRPQVTPDAGVVSTCPGAAGAPRQRGGDVGADRRQQGALQPQQARPGRRLLVVEEHLPVVRVHDEVVGKCGARAEDAQQPAPQSVVPDQRLEQGRGVVQCRHEPGQPVRGQVGVCGVGQRHHDRVGGLVDGHAVAPETGLLERRPGRLGVGEAQPGQPSGGRAAAGRGHARSSPKQRDIGLSR